MSFVDETILRWSHLHYRISNTGKTIFYIKMKSRCNSFFHEVCVCVVVVVVVVVVGGGGGGGMNASHHWISMGISPNQYSLCIIV